MHTPLLLVATMAFMGAAAWSLVRWSPPVAMLASASTGRYAALDGLRGLLACSVLVHHAYIARRLYEGEPWQSPASPLYHFAGDAAVAIFFMITGLLFWDKALGGGLRFPALMRSRVRRILPLHAFCLLLVIAICMAQGDMGAVPVSDDLRGIARWLTLGLLGEARINNVPTRTVDAGATWSLTIEWLFYLLLVPLATVFAKPTRFAGLLASACVAVFVLRRTGHFDAQGRLLTLLPFFGGMIAAYAVRNAARRAPGGSRGRRWRIEGVLASVAVVASAGLVVAFYHRGNSQLLNLLLVPAFIAIVFGNDLGTLLQRRSMRWLGHISFSVYLMHGIVLLSALRFVDRDWPIAQMGDGTYAAVVALIGALVVGISSTTYLLIERTFFEPPRWLAQLRRSIFALPR